MKPFALLQARGADVEMRIHEHGSFASAMQVPESQIATFDLVSDDVSAIDPDDYCGFLIGGSGDYNGRGHDPWLLAAVEFVRDVLVERHVPTFGCCFGLHLIGRALGSEVITDLEHREVGTFTLLTTKAAADCPIFRYLPEVFLAQQGHNDRLTSLPEGATLLCQNPAIPVQAFRLLDRPLWASQFHPELDMEANRTRYMRYIVNYVGKEGPDENDPVLASLRPTPHATALLRRFANLVRTGTP